MMHNACLFRSLATRIPPAGIHESGEGFPATPDRRRNLMDQPRAPAYVVSQRVRCRSRYHAGEVGTVVEVHTTTPRVG
jgi:hypothetical protein